MSTRILQGDCRTVLATLPDASVHCCVTSPPYFGLRDYGMADQIGLEQTPAAFVAELVTVFRDLRRVLRDDGTLWLNLGDGYASGGRGGGGAYMDQRGDKAWGPRAGTNGWRSPPPGLKHKDLLGIPWRVAFALQEDGWYLRQEIIWQKPNPMPESVTDRCTKAHEHLFLLTKEPTYYCDMAAIAEPVAGNPDAPRNRWDTKDYDVPGQKPQKRVSRSGNSERKPRPGPASSSSNQAGSVPWEGTTRNKRSVWTVATQPFSGAHFATFPPALIVDCIKAGCPPGGVVIDPFFGAGTTGLVADRLHRDCIGIELNPAYIDIATSRITAESPLFAEITP